MYRLLDGPTWFHLRYASFRMLKRNTVLPPNRKDFPMFPTNFLRYASFDSIDNEWKISAIWGLNAKICSIVLQMLLTNWSRSTRYLSNYSNCFASCSSVGDVLISANLRKSRYALCNTDIQLLNFNGWNRHQPQSRKPLQSWWRLVVFLLIVSRSYSVRSRALCLASLGRCRKSRFRNLEVSPCCCDGLSPVCTTARCLNHFTYFRCIA